MKDAIFCFENVIKSACLRRKGKEPRFSHSENITNYHSKGNTKEFLDSRAILIFILLSNLSYSSTYKRTFKFLMKEPHLILLSTSLAQNINMVHQAYKGPIMKFSLTGNLHIQIPIRKAIHCFKNCTFASPTVTISHIH